MNDRIRELAEQAGMTDDKFGLFFAKDRHEEGVDLEKFAELIVQECIDQFCRSGAVSTDGSIVVGVKKHFGVEE